MLDKFVDKVEEQRSVYFTGKINILLASSKQLKAQIYLIEGEIVNVRYSGIEGIKAFYNLCFNLHQSDIFIVEPELVSLDKVKIKSNFGSLIKTYLNLEEQFKEAESKRPPKNLKVLINSDLITQDTNIDSDEYELLCSMSDYNLVEDIYKYCKMLDYQITNSLVSLRKKKAIKVIKFTKDGK